MNKFISLVLCQIDENRSSSLYIAPPWNGLEKGNRIMVETPDGDELATVIDCMSVRKDSGEYKFILACKGVSELGRVLGKVEFKKFTYEEDGNESAD